jgi:hypothetical protein
MNVALHWLKMALSCECRTLDAICVRTTDDENSNDDKNTSRTSGNRDC